MEKNEILIAYGSDGRVLARQILQAAGLDALIGKRNARIGIKPNLVIAAPAEGGATTHPSLAAGVIEYLQEKGFGNIGIYEGSWVGDATARAFDVCGYRALAKEYGVELIDTQKQPSYSCDCGGVKLNLCQCVKEIDFLINMPVLKGHCQTSVTCALKNMKGLIPNSEKRRFHTMGLMKPIAHLNAGIRQGFILVDAICGDLNFEEGGNPVERNQVLGFLDPVLCDAWAAESMGYEISEVPYIPLAERLRIGSADTGNAVVKEVNHPSDAAPQQRFRAPRRVQALTRNVVQSDACSACFANLVYALERLNEAGVRLPEKICIGQGFQGRAGEVGVGRCTAGFACSLKGCPPKADDIVRFLRDAAGNRSR